MSNNTENANVTKTDTTTSDSEGINVTVKVENGQLIATIPYGEKTKIPEMAAAMNTKGGQFGGKSRRNKKSKKGGKSRKARKSLRRK
jgi:hypothetical protein